MKSEAGPEKKRFIEDFGAILERQGMPRMAGRIMGWLLISDKPYQTVNDLMEALRASKGSISTNTQLLIRLDLIERTSMLGERRDYFRMKAGALSQHTKATIAEITTFRELAERGLSLIEGEDDINRRWLEDALSIYLFFEKEWPALMERWEQERIRQTTDKLA